METLTQSSSGDSKIVNANRRGKRGKLPPAMKVNAEITRYEQHTKTVTTAERNTTKTRIPYDNDDSYDDDDFDDDDDYDEDGYGDEKNDDYDVDDGEYGEAVREGRGSTEETKTNSDTELNRG